MAGPFDNKPSMAATATATAGGELLLLCATLRCHGDVVSKQREKEKRIRPNQPERPAGPAS